MRQIVLDTETTGLDPSSGHRITEIGCVELFNMVPTQRKYQQYINPQREISERAVEITGLTYGFLKDFPTFDKVVESFLDFIGDAQLIIHNASFDMKFLNAELESCNLPTLSFDRVIDTLSLARKQFPGAKNNLDALCSRFGVSNENRNYHGALLDSEILAEVYLHLMGGKQSAFLFAEASVESINNEIKIDFPYRSFLATDQEMSLHKEFLNKISESRWGKFPDYF